MSERRGAPARPIRIVGYLTIIAAIAVALTVGLVGSVGAREVGPTGTPDPSPTTEYVPETTSTLPAGGELGHIVPRPNSGQAPETPGDPGGTEQVGLFWALLVVTAGITVFVWWRSRIARGKRDAAGKDPVTLAKQSGGDVRKPRPPGIVD